MSRPGLVIGGYTPDTEGSGPGLTVARQHPDGRLEAVAETAVSGPSFVIAHPRLPLLYAVLERAEDGGLAVLADEDPAPGCWPSTPAAARCRATWRSTPRAGGW